MLDSFFVFQTGFLPWIKWVDHARFLKAENDLFCMKPIIFALVKESNRWYTNVGVRWAGGEGNQSSQTVRRTRGNARALQMESSQELASTLSAE